jgi:hypothetical protein
MKWIRKYWTSSDPRPNSEDAYDDLNQDTDKLFGRLIDVGWIVRFRDSETDFDEAIAAGKDHMMDYFCDAIGGIRIGHIKELIRLEFFQKVSEKVGRDVYIGVWQEIPPWKLHHVIEILEEIIPQSKISSFLEDVVDMCLAAINDGCPIGIMLSDNRYVTMNQS